MNRLLIGWRKNAAHVLLGLSTLLLVALLFCSPGLVPIAHAASANTRVSAQPATSSHCSSLGSLVDSLDLRAPLLGPKIGEIDVYYNSSTGYNCAYTYSSGASWGVSKYMGIYIAACAQTTPSGYCDYTSVDEDYGFYSYYAGPVGVYARGHCIFFEGTIYWNGYESSLEKVGHCG